MNIAEELFEGRFPLPRTKLIKEVVYPPPSSPVIPVITVVHVVTRIRVGIPDYIRTHCGIIEFSEETMNRWIVDHGHWIIRFHYRNGYYSRPKESEPTDKQKQDRKLDWCRDTSGPTCPICKKVLEAKKHMEFLAR